MEEEKADVEENSSARLSHKSACRRLTVLCCLLLNDHHPGHWSHLHSLWLAVTALVVSMLQVLRVEMVKLVLAGRQSYSMLGQHGGTGDSRDCV